MDKLIFASTNPGKIAELKRFAKEYDTEVLSLEDIGFDQEIEETGQTFKQNAQIKVEAILEYVKDQGDYKDLWIIGDDSGLMIDALDGQPGVHSRRWAGYEMQDQELVDYCLERMKKVPSEERLAQFVSMIALIKQGEPIKFFAGKTQGTIAERVEPGVKLIPGYPYRQLFILKSSGKLIGDPESYNPNELTHRQKSFKALFKYLNKS